MKYKKKTWNIFKVERKMGNIFGEKLIKQRKPQRDEKINSQILQREIALFNGNVQTLK